MSETVSDVSDAQQGFPVLVAPFRYLVDVVSVEDVYFRKLSRVLSQESIHKIGIGEIGIL